MGPEFPIVVHFCRPDDLPGSTKKEFEHLQAKVKNIRSDRVNLTKTILKKDKKIGVKKAQNKAMLDNYPRVNGQEQTIVKDLRAITKNPEKSVVLGALQKEKDEWFVRGEAMRATAWKE